MLILDATAIERLLDMSSCIEAVEAAFRARGSGAIAQSGVAGVSLEGGKLHAKLATLDLGRRYAVAKINANLPNNPLRRGLPSIQGVVILFDGVTGTPLAALESGTITAMRTAAASAVAAKWLALPEARSLALIGCGVQARAHVSAMRCVRRVEELHAYDVDQTAAEKFCAEFSEHRGINCRLAADVRAATLQCHIVVTSTPSRGPVLDAGDLAPGTFVAAVGADNEDKQEMSTSLMRTASVVVDDLDQCAKIGDLHHALAAGVMTISDVRASLDQIVAQRVQGRHDDNEIIVFDSTGVAIEDAAAAAAIYEKAIESGAGLSVNLAKPRRPLTAHHPPLSVQSSS